MEKKIWHNVGEEPDLHSKIMLDNGAVCSVEQWSAKVAETHKWAYVSDLLNLSNVQRTLKLNKAKEIDLVIHTIIAECCDWLAMNTNLSHNEIEGCRNLMLTVKEEQCKAQKRE